MPFTTPPNAAILLLSQRERDRPSSDPSASVHWDSSLPPATAAEKCGAPIAWKSIATMPIEPDSIGADLRYFGRACSRQRRDKRCSISACSGRFSCRHGGAVGRFFLEDEVVLDAVKDIDDGVARSRRQTRERLLADCLVNE